MAATRLPMRRLRDLLRLKYDAGLSHRAIAQACAMGLGTVTAYLHRAAAAGLAWPLCAFRSFVAADASACGWGTEGRRRQQGSQEFEPGRRPLNRR